MLNEIIEDTKAPLDDADGSGRQANYVIRRLRQECTQQQTLEGYKTEFGIRGTPTDVGWIYNTL